MNKLNGKRGTNLLFLLTATLLLLVMNSGCSVFMAMSGKEEANISALSVGQDRSIVIANLGEPHKTATANGKTVDIFKLQRGNAPSAGRALAHGALDLVTLGGWEIIGTPIEAMTGESYTVTVEYDENNKVTKVHSGTTQVGGSM